ncbi:MAG TPA: hypothetical protein VGI72_12810 [Gaiellales bacterium]
MADAVASQDVCEGVGAVAGAIVGEDALDRCAVLGVALDHLGGEGGAIGAALGRAQLGGGEARVVINGDVGLLPAGSIVSMDAVLEDAFADLPEPAQLLGVQMHQVADRVVLIPIRRWSRRALSPRAAVTYQHPPDRRCRPAQRG